MLDFDMDQEFYSEEMKIINLKNITEDHILEPIYDYKNVRTIFIRTSNITKIPSGIVKILQSKIFINLKTFSLGEIPNIDPDFTGQIPDTVVIFNLINTNITSFPRGLPEGMVEINLSYNMIDSDGFDRKDENGFDLLPKSVKILNISNNRIKWIPKTIPLRNLTSLVMRNNGLTAIPNTLPSTMLLLDASHNFISEMTFSLPDSLRFLKLDNNLISVLDLTSIHKLKDLETLHIQNNIIRQVNGTHFPPSLTHVSLMGNILECFVSEKEYNSGKRILISGTINIFSLTHNRLESLRGLNFGPSSHIVDLQSSFDVSHNPLLDFEGIIFPESLTSLNFDFCRIKELSKTLPNGLKIISGCSNRISELAPDDLPSDISTLMLRDNGIITIDPYTKEQRTSLKCLDLSMNGLNSLPQTWIDGFLTGIERLDLRGNIFPHISFITSMKHLVSFSGSHNKISSLSNVVLKRNIILFDVSENEISSLTINTFKDINPHIHLDITNNDIKFVSLSLKNFFRTHLVYNSQLLEQLPLSLIEDSEMIHRHSIQESVRNFITTFFTRDLVSKSLPLKTVANEIIADKNIGVKIIKSILFPTGIIAESDEDTIQIIPERDRVSGENFNPQSILIPGFRNMGSDEGILYSDFLTVIWTFIRSHPERESMIKNIIDDFPEYPPCFTGIIGIMVSSIIGFVETENKIQISLNEQIGTIITSIGEKLETEGRYTEQLHKELATERLKELQIPDIMITEWTSYI